ncbi:hypothetical protein [Natrinema caseinilyticum]|uniref:hypothetical protein n=1 Tax=Natrinema caseinilyticum TaxID=2961570 RepID=UPI0020C1E1E1|nr:hypothetical protein [Natrinema caseinilyticum]
MSGHPAGKRGIDPYAKSAALWGAIGFLSVLVLVQGAALVREPIVTMAQGLALATLVGLATTLGSYLLESRLAAWARRRRGT